MKLTLPRQRAIDRRVPYEAFLLEHAIVVGGRTIEIVLSQVGGDFGSMPGDPPPFCLADPRERAGLPGMGGPSGLGWALGGWM